MNLTKDKIDELKLLHKKERDKRVCDRIKAVLLINENYSYEQTARILLIDDDTVRRHVQEYAASEKLENNNKGSESKLEKHQALELVNHLQANTYINVKPIMEYVQTILNTNHFTKFAMQ